MTLPDYDPDLIDIHPTVASLTALLGPELYAQLSDQLGGRRLTVSAAPGENSPITICIGMEAARRISEIYAGCVFDVPLQAGRNARILKLYHEGLPVVRIPNAVGCSYRTVRRVLDAEKDKHQMDLF